jgi:hypothetical protein
MTDQFDRDDPLAQLDAETPKACAALHDYAMLGPSRSLRQLAEQYRSQNGVRTPTRQMSQLAEWSAAFHWQQRVAAYDEQQRRAERLRVEQLRAARVEQLTEADWDMAMQLRKKAAEMLGFPLAKVERETGKRQTLDGEITVEMTVVTPARWGFRDAAQVAETAAKLARLAAGEPNDRTTVAIDGLRPQDLEKMSRDELLALKAEIERRK